MLPKQPDTCPPLPLTTHTNLSLYPPPPDNGWKFLLLHHIQHVASKQLEQYAPRLKTSLKRHTLLLRQTVISGSEKQGPKSAEFKKSIALALISTRESAVRFWCIQMISAQTKWQIAGGSEVSQSIFFTRRSKNRGQTFCQTKIINAVAGTQDK